MTCRVWTSSSEGDGNAIYCSMNLDVNYQGMYLITRFVGMDEKKHHLVSE